MKSTYDNISLLIIEDNPTDLFLLEEMLNSSGLKIKSIYAATRLSEGCTLLSQHAISLVLLDLSLPDSLGMESFLKIQSISQKVPVIILTGLSDSELALEAIKYGAQDYLVKGEFKIDVLVRSIQYSIERKSAEEKIIASEEKYRQMFYKNPFPAWIYDMDTLQMLEVNDAAIQQYGYERDEFIRLTLKDIRPQEDIQELMESISLRNVPQSLKGKIWRHRKKNGDIMLVEITFYQIDYMGKKAMQAQVNDVTERFRLEKELTEQQNVKQRQITDAVLKAQEKERKSIGEELHDNINQILATSKLFISTGLLESNMELVAKSCEYTSMAMEEIRKLSKTLVAPPFIKSGLNGSIEDLAKTTMAAKKIFITTKIELPYEDNIDEGLKLALYRMIQEQLNNIIKYAEATAVNISITQSEEKIKLSVSDNGKGFDTSRQSNGIGLTNIISRAELFNGKVVIDSSPGNGCRLQVECQAPSIASPKAA